MRIDVTVVVARIKSGCRHLWVYAFITSDGDGVVDRSVQAQSLDVLADFLEVVTQRDIVDLPIITVFDIVAVELFSY